MELKKVLTTSEADETWGLPAGSARQSCIRGKLADYIELGLVRKSGGVWLIAEQAMREVFGDPAASAHAEMPEGWEDDAIVGVAEAAEMLGWSKQQINTYIRRGKFPAPIQRLASGPIWARDQIESFKGSRES